MASANSEIAARLDAAGRYARDGYLEAAADLVDTAAMMPGAAAHGERLAAARAYLVRRGAYDEPWVPDDRQWRRCPATENVCPHAGGQCADECALQAGGWQCADGDQCALAGFGAGGDPGVMTRPLDAPALPPWSTVIATDRGGD